MRNAENDATSVVPDFGDEPTCTCGDESDDHVFTGGGFCNLCDCERYQPTRVTLPGWPVTEIGSGHNWPTRVLPPAKPAPAEEPCRCIAAGEGGVHWPSDHAPDLAQRPEAGQ